MITYLKQIIPSAEDQSRLELLGNLSSLLFFDIETTGFNRTYDHIISITFMYHHSEGWQVKQLFAESSSDELLILRDAMTLFNEKEVHITYNGNAFDIPFLNVKYNYYNISASLNKSKSYDLYRIAKNTLNLENYKLKAIERYLGINRVDQISGLECIENYRQYLSTKDARYANLILEHNFEDVLNLLALTKMIDFLPPEALNTLKVRSFAYKEIRYYFSEVTVKPDFLEVFLWHHDHPIPSLPLNAFNKMNYYYENGTQIIKEKDDLIFVKLPIYAKEYNGDQYILIDYETFSSDQLQLEPLQQSIIQCNQFYVYENLSKVLVSLFEKALA